MRAIAATVDSVWSAGCALGEGPTVDPATGAVWFVDIRSRELLRWQPDGATARWSLPCRIGSVAPPSGPWLAPTFGATDSVLLAAGDRGLAWIGLGEGGSVDLRPIVHPESDVHGNRFNDGKIGPDNRYYAGTMDDAELRDSGSLWAFDSGGVASLVDAGYRVPNGPAFSPDGRTIYHTDSFRRIIYAFDLATDGRVTRKRVFAVFDAAEGSPDGMTTDTDGNLWVAFWDGSRIERIAPDGARDGMIRMPVSRPTSCIFAAGDPRILFVTSAAAATQGEALAGALFRVTVKA